MRNARHARVVSVVLFAAIGLVLASRGARADDLSPGQKKPCPPVAKKVEARPMATHSEAKELAKTADKPKPAPEKKEPAKEGERPKAGQTESKVAEPKLTDPASEKKPPAYREVQGPAAPAPKPAAGDDGEKISLTREDLEAANDAAANYGAETGYARGYNDGLTVARGKIRVLTREEAVELGLKAARRAMERRFGKQGP